MVLMVRMTATTATTATATSGATAGAADDVVPSAKKRLLLSSSEIRH
jgi:hypothetical protein